MAAASHLESDDAEPAALGFATYSVQLVILALSYLVGRSFATVFAASVDTIYLCCFLEESGSKSAGSIEDEDRLFKSIMHADLVARQMPAARPAARQGDASWRF